MKEKISLFKKRSFETVNNLTKKQKISLLLGLLGVILTISTLVYADVGHDGAEPVASIQTEQIVVRKVGDVDTDALSQEGLSSFYGEITSNDIGSINSPREGVISSWNVSVGDEVTVGKVLGYVTVTTLSAEQQQGLAEQQAAALKAKLDFETSQQISQKTKDVFTEIANRTKNLADKQRSLFIGSNTVGSTTFATELNAIENKKKLLDSKVQAFAQTSLVEIYSIVGQEGLNPLTTTGPYNNLIFGVKPFFGLYDIDFRIDYYNLVQSYIRKVKNRTVTVAEIQQFIDSTAGALAAGVNTSNSEGYTPETLRVDTARLSEIQADFRDLTNELAQATIDYAGKERERLQVDIDASKQITELDNQFSLQLLDQDKSNQLAQNEARAAQLLADKLAISASGVTPIIASRKGVIGTIEKNVGAYVTASDRIGVISNENPIKRVRFTIPASWKDISKGDSLSIAWRAEYGMGSAIITGISPVIDERGGYQAEAVISKETVFPIGASVRIIPENSKKGVFVNRKAIVFEGVNPFVWIVTEGNTIRKQEVKVGRGLGEYVEILSGLERGFSYLVILDPNIVLENGKSMTEIIKTKVETSAPTQIQDESQPHEH